MSPNVANVDVKSILEMIFCKILQAPLITKIADKLEIIEVSVFKWKHHQWHETQLLAIMKNSMNVHFGNSFQKERKSSFSVDRSKRFLKENQIFRQNRLQ